VQLMIQPEAGLQPVVQAIRRAKRTVDIAIFRLNRRDVEIALGVAVERGVKVRALIAHTNRGGADKLRKLEQRLLAAGVTVTRSNDDLVKYHGKYLIVDDVLHLLGFNFTDADTMRSRSFGIQTRDRRAVKDAMALFEADVTRQPYTPAPHSALIVSPENARESLMAFIRGARRRLAIYDARLEDKAFVSLLREKIKAGVRVQVIGRAPKLEGGTEVRLLKDLRLHVRAILRDGTRAFVGSQSLRSLELDRRREVGLVISNPTVAKKMTEIFDLDWENAAPAKEKEKEKEKGKENDKPEEAKGGEKAAEQAGKPAKPAKDDARTKVEAHAEVEPVGVAQ
jgi:cardiolipin synthase